MKALSVSVSVTYFFILSKLTVDLRMNNNESGFILKAQS